MVSKPYDMKAILGDPSVDFTTMGEAERFLSESYLFFKQLGILKSNLA